MNQTDKAFYKALKFISKRNVRGKKPKVLDDGYLISDLLSLDYVNTNTVITKTGLEELRKLESIRHRDLSIWIPIASLIISITALIISIFLP